MGMWSSTAYCAVLPSSISSFADGAIQETMHQVNGWYVLLSSSVWLNLNIVINAHQHHYHGQLSPNYY